MTKEELKKYLPHREPMLLIDEATIDEDRVARSKYHVTGEEFFLKGHYPGQPVVPGVILCEIMAQSCALLLKDDLIGRIPLYAGIENVRFKNPVLPGDTVEVEAKLSNKRAMMYFCNAKLSVNGKVCALGNLSFALIDDTRENK